MFKLTTDRLTLVPLSAAQLRQYLERPEQLELALGLQISRAVITPRVQRAIGMKLDKMAGDNISQFAWQTHWLLIINSVQFGAGLAGFKGLPNKNGEAEIGYGIDPTYQGRGFITEAVQALITWAFEEPACQAVIARDTQKTNTASLRVLAKVGMTVYNESEEAIDLRVPRGSFKHS